MGFLPLPSMQKNDTKYGQFERGKRKEKKGSASAGILEVQRCDHDVALQGIVILSTGEEARTG